MEQPLVVVTPRIDPTFITPDHVRGLSLGRVSEEFGTAGLYVRTKDTLERLGFGEHEMIQLSLELGLALHADDPRTNGHYTDHLMRVMLHVMESFGIRDPNIIAAAPLHDTFEDHPKDLVLALTGERIENRDEALIVGRAALARFTNDEVASIVSVLTNPPVAEGEDKIDSYTRHTTDLVLHHPKPRVVKVGDFIENAGGNHATLGEKQHQLDLKYIRQYRIHKMGLFLPDSLIVGAERQRALHLLSRGHTRALGRLANYEAQHQMAG